MAGPDPALPTPEEEHIQRLAAEAQRLMQDPIFDAACEALRDSYRGMVAAVLGTAPKGIDDEGQRVLLILRYRIEALELVVAELQATVAGGTITLQMIEERTRDARLAAEDGFVE